MGAIVDFFRDPAHWQGTTGIPNRLLEHLIISGLSILVATVIAVPLGLYIGHTNRGSGLAINLANIPEREEDARQQQLRHDDQWDELHRLELRAREHAQEDAEVDGADRHQRFEAEDQSDVAAVVYVQHGEREDQDLDRLDQRQDREPEHVAEHDLAAPQRARHQPFQRSLRTFVEEGDDGHHEDEEEYDQADEGRAEVVERVETGTAV